MVAIHPVGAAEPDRRLVEAAKAGDAVRATALIRQRVDVNAPEADGTTALHWAVWQDDLELTDQLIRAGADVRASNRYGVTALYLAGVNGRAAVIDRLLKAGADANAASPEGETALMTAARAGNVEAARVLLANGADVNAREAWRGQTALMWAAAQNHPAMVTELIANGADANAQSAVQNWERQTTDEPREKWLPPGGLTPLLFAARQGSLESAQVLIEAGADVNAADPAEITPLLSAVINGHYDVAGLLLERGADPNLADTDGRTPLFAAVDMNTMPVSNVPMPKVLENRLTSFDVIGMLLARGADVNVQLKAQQAYRAKLDRGTDTVLTTGSTPLLRAAKAADVAVVRLLLEKGADAQLATRTGTNPLMIAAGLGTKEEDTTGRTKTEEGTIETITLLLDRGIDINAADTTGRTALHGAALQGYDRVVRFLAERGATLTVVDKRGFTPLDVAMGLAGGVGFDGKASNPHESTAALLRELIAGAGHEDTKTRR
jgi:uncharacterized protein